MIPLVPVKPKVFEFPTNNGQVNRIPVTHIKVSYSYDQKKKQIVRRIDGIEVENGFERFALFLSPTERTSVIQLKRFNGKELMTCEMNGKVDIVNRSGPTYNAVVDFAARHNLTLE